jgi:hypothetical protein
LAAAPISLSLAAAELVGAISKLGARTKFTFYSTGAYIFIAIKIRADHINSALWLSNWIFLAIKN